MLNTRITKHCRAIYMSAFGDSELDSIALAQLRPLPDHEFSILDVFSPVRAFKSWKTAKESQAHSRASEHQIIALHQNAYELSGVIPKRITYTDGRMVSV